MPSYGLNYFIEFTNTIIRLLVCNIVYQKTKNLVGLFLLKNLTPSDHCSLFIPCHI
jgi:hypothetical protein